MPARAILRPARRRVRFRRAGRSRDRAGRSRRSMLSTVVLPAPFGPITLVMRPGSATKLTSGGGLDAAEGDADAGHLKLIVVAPSEQRTQRYRNRGRRAVRGSIRRSEPRQRADARPPARAKARPAAIRRRTAADIRRDFESSSGPHNADGGADHRPKHPASAADDHRQQEQDRLRERKRIRRDEHHQRRENRAGQAGEHRGQRKGRGLDDHRD